MKTGYSWTLDPRSSAFSGLVSALVAARILFAFASPASAQWVPLAITNIGHIDVAGSAHGVALSNPYAYVAHYGSGLLIYDVSDPANPVLAARTNNACCAVAVTLSAHYAYLANSGDGLRIYDIANPTYPISLSHTYPGASVRWVTVSGDYAYVANWVNGIVVYSVTNPASPVEVGRVDHSEYPSGNLGTAVATAVSGRYLYLANGQDGLRIYDLIDPAQPVLVGHTNDVGEASQVALWGDYALVANGADGLRIYDVSDPAQPVRVGHAYDGGVAKSVTVSGDYAYLASDTDGLRVYDIRDPASPVSVGHIDNGGAAQAVALSGEYAYLANYDDGLRIYRIYQPGWILPPTNCVAWWPGDGDARDIAEANHGTLSNGATATATGQVGPCFSFDGVDDYLQMPPVTRGLANGTVEFWFNTRAWDWTANPGGIFMWAATLGLPGENVDGMSLGTHPSFTGNGALLFGIYDVDGWHWANSGVSPEANVWHHLAGTWGSGGLSIYVDGVLKGTNAYTGPAPNYTEHNLAGRSSWTGSGVNASIDELAIYDRALSAGEIQSIHQAGSAGKLRLVPPSVFTLAATEVGIDRATLQGSVNPYGADAVAWFEWGPTTNYGSSAGLTNVGSGTAPIAVNAGLTGLGEGVTYHYRLVASNRFGLVGGTDQMFIAAVPFTPFNAGLPGISDSSVAWGDYDNDGLLDILLTGMPTSYGIAQVWRNTGSGFTNINAGLPDIVLGSAAWGDYDNDGDLDILLTGYSDAVSDYIAQVWRNTGSGFTNMNVALPGVYFSSVAWGDYDNDGRLDIVLMGYTGTQRIAQVWRNTGSGFTNINAGLPGVADGSVAWGDYDNDGDLDILLMGETGSDDIAQVWRNTGRGFTNINAGLPGLENGSVAWEDYDNDGDLDILVTGRSASGLIAQVWRNTGSGFVNINAGLPGLQDGSVAWGDYDNDGRPDILLTGCQTINCFSIIAQVWRNTGSGFVNVNAGLSSGARDGSVAWGDYDNDGRLDILLTGSGISQVWRNTGPVTNTPPTAPTNLRATVLGHSVSLSWTAANDGQTPANGLTYNCRVGTTPGAVDVVSPQAALDTGFRRLVAMGNAQHGLGAVFTNLPEGGYYWSVQAVDSAFAGSPFAAEGSFAVHAPEVVTQPAADLTPTSVTLRGSVNPWLNEARAWFEYGLTTNYGRATPTVNPGSGSSAVPFSVVCSGLFPRMTYHYRAVASNSAGLALGANQTVTLPGPSMAAPSLSELPNLILPQGGSTSVVFAVSPAESDIRVRGNNPVLLPDGSLGLGGSGSIRSLAVSPDTNHSGSAQITVTASDGTRAIGATFNLTVTPRFDGPTSWIHLTHAQTVAPQTFRFQIEEVGAGSISYAVEYHPDLSPTNAWGIASNVVVTALGGGLFQVDTVPPPGDVGFYRVKGFRLPMAGFDSAELIAQEGAGIVGPVVVFDGIYAGTLSYAWTDEQGTTWTGQVQVDGTTAVVPVPASFLDDDPSIGRLQYLTLRLEAGVNYALGGTAESTVTVEENDAEWQGVLQTANGTLGFELTLVQANGSLQGQIRSGGSGFFPTNALAHLSFKEDHFVALARNVPLPPLTGSPWFAGTNYVSLGLTAVNGPGQTNVSPTQVQGAATLFSVVPGRPYWDTELSGTFLLLRSPTAPSTNEVPLYPAP